MISMWLKSMSTTVFCAMSHKLVEHFVEHMSIEFEMSLVGELTYFLKLHVKQIGNGTFISQSKYTQNLVKFFGLKTNSSSNTCRNTCENLLR